MSTKTLGGVIRRAKTIFERRFTELLAFSAVGVYLLIIVGATTSLLDAGSACAGWPTCRGGLLPGKDPMAVLAWGHRVVGLLVGIVLVITVIVTWITGRTRIRAVVTGAALLYPVQTLLGGIIALEGASQTLSTIHLIIAMTIFSGLLLGLLWRLDDVAGEQSASLTPGVSSTEPRPANHSTVERPNITRTELLLAYFSLTKPRLWWLLSMVAIAAMALAAGPSLSLYTVVATITGGILAISASGTFNNVLERDRDAAMERTADRPLVNGTISPTQATLFGFSLLTLSMAVFLWFVNPLAAGLGFLAVVFYSVIYTLVLKPNTEQNIVIGGAVGAFPALIGWAAVTETVELPAVVLGTIVVLWTPAHFYNLALAYKEDYARAGFPMLPVSRGDARTRRHILGYLGATMVAAVSLGTIESLSWTYAVTAFVLGIVFLWSVIRLFEEQSDRAAYRSFHAANAYLGVILVAVVIDSLVLV